jgi:hypothetical protein
MIFWGAYTCMRPGESFAARYELELEPWIIAEQLRHSDGGALVTQLYGHPDRIRAIERIRRTFGGNIHQLRPQTGESQGKPQPKAHKQRSSRRIESIPAIHCELPRPADDRG